jgi:hypothetical protein
MSSSKTNTAIPAPLKITAHKLGEFFASVKSSELALTNRTARITIINIPLKIQSSLIVINLQIMT